MRTAALAYGCSVRVEGALAEPKGTLIVAEAVGWDAELRVLEADIKTRFTHLAHVQVVVSGELR